MVWDLLNWVIHNFLFKLIHFFSWKRILKATHFIQDHTQCPNICFFSILLVFPKFRSKIKRRSNTIILSFSYSLWRRLSLNALILCTAYLFSTNLFCASKLIIHQIIIGAKEIIVNHIKWVVSLFH